MSAPSAPLPTTDRDVLYVFANLHKRVLDRYDGIVAEKGPEWFARSGDLLAVAEEIRNAMRQAVPL